jgi:hypothetical protein
MSRSNFLLNKIAIPVAPPSRNPLGSKKALRPILERAIPIAICTYSESDFNIFAIPFGFMLR